jgi:hypothetical protein
MAPTPFEGAFGNVALISKTRVALEASCDETWCRQTISELRLLEAVISQVKDISPTTASEETIRIVGLFGLAHVPHLEYFLQELGKLRPDLDCYFGEDDRPGVKGPPLWATAVERNTTALMNNIGTQLQLINALPRVDSLRERTTSGELQRIPKIPSDPLSLALETKAPSQQFIVTGNENVYQGIEACGNARVHLGNSYVFSGVPKASVEKLSQKLDDLASSRQADALQSLLGEIQKKQSDSSNMLSAVDARTLQLLAQLGQVAHVITAANEAPSLSMDAQSKQLRKTTLKRPGASISTNMSSIFEIVRIWLGAMIMTLLMGSRSFQSFVRSARTLTRSPSMLLGSNIMVVDALRREFSLPYEHFCRWPLMLAHLQCEFKGRPGESYVANLKFGLFRAAKKPQNQVMIPFEQWERSVFPGDRVFMSIDLEQFDRDKCPSCGCALRETRLNPVFPEWFVFPALIALQLKLTISSTECGQLVHTVRSNDLQYDKLRTSQKYCPMGQNLPLETSAETMNVQRFARVHGRHTPSELIARRRKRDLLHLPFRVPLN